MALQSVTSSRVKMQLKRMREPECILRDTAQRVLGYAQDLCLLTISPTEKGERPSGKLLVKTAERFAKRRAVLSDKILPERRRRVTYICATKNCLRPKRARGMCYKCNTERSRTPCARRGCRSLCKLNERVVIEECLGYMFCARHIASLESRRVDPVSAGVCFACGKPEVRERIALCAVHNSLVEAKNG